eukprot:gene36245-43968_t
MLVSFFFLWIGFVCIDALIVDRGVKRIILYDGVCNFCNKWVDTVLSLDSKNLFKFAALQSETGKHLLEYIGKRSNDLSSVIYIRSLDPSPDFYTKSDAALKVAEDLGIP